METQISDEEGETCRIAGGRTQTKKKEGGVWEKRRTEGGKNSNFDTSGGKNRTDEEKYQKSNWGKETIPEEKRQSSY